MAQDSKTVDRLKTQITQPTDCQKEIILAEQRLTRLEMQLRNIVVGTRLTTHQKMLECSIEQQHRVVAELKTENQTGIPSKSSAARYVPPTTRLEKPQSKNTDDTTN